MGNGPRATPTIAGDRVFSFSGEGVLTALNLADGKVIWSRDTVQQFQGKPAEYGMACSPLVVDDKVIVTVGAPGATVVSCSVSSGEVMWTAGENEATGYSSPALLQLGGRQQLVVFTGSSVLSLDAPTGDILWRYPFETDFGCNIATPIQVQDQLFFSSGENHGCVLLAISAQEQPLRVQEVWTSLGPKSVLRNEWQTSILLDGYLYGMDNVGSAGAITHLTCIKASSGERMWQQLRYGKGNLIAADGKLFISTMKGELIVARASPERYDELGRAVVIGKTRQAPALADGRLYLRDDEEIVCLDVRKQ
jgi:outer membrane protein assembly factor BamB